MVFAKHTDENVTSLVKALETLVLENEKLELRVVVNLIGDNREALEKAAAELGKDLKAVPIVVPVEYTQGPAAWNFSADADLTVFMYKAKKVVDSRAFAAGKVDAEAIKTILAAVPEKLLK